MASEVGKPAFEYEARSLDSDLLSEVENKFSQNISEAYLIKNKQERVQALSLIKENILSEMLVNEEEGITESDLMDSLKKIEKKKKTSISISFAENSIFFSVFIYNHIYNFI